MVAEVDLMAGVPTLGDLEAVALEFARTVPVAMIAETVQGLVGGLFDAVIGPFGSPWADEDQPPAPWACTGCGSKRGFRRRGLRPGRAAGGDPLRPGAARRGYSRLPVVWDPVQSRRPAARLGRLPAPHRRAGRARCQPGREVVYAKAARLLKDLAGVELWPRSLRRDVLRLAPGHISPDPALAEVPVLLLDGTGVRAGPSKLGVGLNSTWPLGSSPAASTTAGSS